ncbi:NERD domain-containing protein [Gracilibacillus caseinilyticus]|uniref:NERD domain-containing protein n=1 Tax=Gracilibacillus caseinilyticus TaxID=2932256 RepID=A0ABY4ESQ9_9BACI|nr:nuclease-related domain-containing protein [Gracilibacillus caseinilyticus]UOQ47233.1 NERD domain-containing protein [Gracilibacillus caseinilyticus]
MKLLDKLFKKKETETKANSTAKTTKKPIKKHNEKIAARKGEIGEHKINIQLDQFPKEYKHLEDIMIKNPKAKSGYSQIDHILISSYGIFVIETKNYEGTIYGGKDRKVWSVNGKFKMMNPFIQNYGHIKALKSEISEKYHSYFVSVVSFTKRCKFKIDETELRKIASDELLVYDIELTEFINRKVNINEHQHEEPFLTDRQINEIYDQLKAVNIEDQAIRKQHVQLLKEGNKKGTSQNKDSAKCTVCNKPVSEKVKAYCHSNSKFKGKIYCYEHQKTISS